MEKTLLVAGIAALTAFNFIPAGNNGPLSTSIGPGVENPDKSARAGATKDQDGLANPLARMSMTAFIEERDTVPASKPRTEELRFPTSTSTVNNDGKSRTQTIVANDQNGKKYMLVKKNDEIISLSIDGKNIPEKEWNDYRELTEMMEASTGDNVRERDRIRDESERRLEESKMRQESKDREFERSTRTKAEKEAYLRERIGREKELRQREVERKREREDVERERASMERKRQLEKQQYEERVEERPRVEEEEKDIPIEEKRILEKAQSEQRMNQQVREEHQRKEMPVEVKKKLDKIQNEKLKLQVREEVKQRVELQLQTPENTKPINLKVKEKLEPAISYNLQLRKTSPIELQLQPQLKVGEGYNKFQEFNLKLKPGLPYKLSIQPTKVKGTLYKKFQPMKPVEGKFRSLS